MNRIYEGYLDDLISKNQNSDPFYTGPEENKITKKERVISEEIDIDKVDSIIEKLSNMFMVNYGSGIQNMTSLDEILCLSGLKTS